MRSCRRICGRVRTVGRAELIVVGLVKAVAKSALELSVLIRQVFRGFLEGHLWIPKSVEIVVEGNKGYMSVPLLN